MINTLRTSFLMLFIILVTSQNSDGFLNFHQGEYKNNLNLTYGTNRTLDYLQDNQSDSQKTMVLLFLDANKQITDDQHEIYYMKLQLTSGNRSAILETSIPNEQWSALSRNVNFTVRLYENNTLTQGGYTCSGILDANLQNKKQKYQPQLKQQYNQGYRTQSNSHSQQTAKNFYFMSVSLYSSLHNSSPECQININSSYQLQGSSRAEIQNMYCFFTSSITFACILASVVLYYKLSYDTQDIKELICPKSFFILFISSFTKRIAYMVTVIPKINSSVKASIIVLQIIYFACLLFLLMKMIKDRQQEIKSTVFMFISIVVCITDIPCAILIPFQLWPMLFLPCSLFGYQIYKNYQNRQQLTFNKVYLITYPLVLLGFNLWKQLYMLASPQFFLKQNQKPPESTLYAVILALIYVGFITIIFLQHFIYERRRRKQQQKKEQIQTQAIKKQVQKIVDGLNFLQNVQRLRMMANIRIPNCGRCKQLITFDIQSEIQKRVNPNGYGNTSPLLQQERKVYVCKLGCGCLFHRICLLQFVTNNPNAERCLGCKKELSQEIKMIELLI